MVKEKKVSDCASGKYDEWGNCLEVIEVGDSVAIKFKAKAKACRPDKFKEWQKKIAENQIRTMD